MPIQECVDLAMRGELPDSVGNIDCEEVAAGDVAFDGVAPDMIGIDVVGLGPSKFANGFVGCGAKAGRLRADKRVLAVGLIPNRYYVRARGAGHFKRSKLRFRLMAKAVSNPERVLLQVHFVAL